MDDTSYATAGFSDRDLDAALEAIAAAGFPQAEIGFPQAQMHVAEPPTGRALSEFRARVESHGLRARTVHAPAGRTVLGAPDEDWRRENMVLLRRYLRFAGGIGATEMVIHPVPNPNFVPDAEDPAVPGRIRDAVPRSLDDLVPTAEEAGVRITLENLPYDCDYPFLTMRDLRPLVNAYPEKQVGLVLDSGHVGIHRMDPAEEIRAAGSRLRGTHLHDVDFDEEHGDHRAPTHGGFDWDAILAALSEVQYPGPWTFEVIVPRHGESQDELARITREAAVGWGLSA